MVNKNNTGIKEIDRDVDSLIAMQQLYKPNTKEYTILDIRIKEKQIENNNIEINKNKKLIDKYNPFFGKNKNDILFKKAVKDYDNGILEKQRLQNIKIKTNTTPVDTFEDDIDLMTKDMDKDEEMNLMEDINPPTALKDQAEVDKEKRNEKFITGNSNEEKDKEKVETEIFPSGIDDKTDQDDTIEKKPRDETPPPDLTITGNTEDKEKTKQENIDDLNESHKEHLTEDEIKEADRLNIKYTDYKVLDLIRKAESLDDTPIEDILITHNQQKDIMKTTKQYIPFNKIHTSSDTYDISKTQPVSVSYVPLINIKELVEDAFKSYEDKVDTVDEVIITETIEYDTQILVQKKQNSGEEPYIVVSFRGTNEFFNFTSSNFGDVFTDLYSSITNLREHFPFIKEEDNLHVHRGFCEALKAIYNKLTSKLQTYDSSYYLDTGSHSLGGALNTIFLYVYSLDNKQNLRLRYNVNVGSPRVFYANPYENKYYDVNKYNQKVNLIRMYNTLDLVPKLPLQSTPHIFDSLTRSASEIDVNKVLLENIKTSNFILDTIRQGYNKIINTVIPFKLTGFKHVGFGLELTKDSYIQHHYIEPEISQAEITDLNNLYSVNNPSWKRAKDFYNSFEMSYHLEPSYKKGMESVPQLIGLPYHNELLYKKNITNLPDEIFTNGATHEMYDDDNNTYENIRPNLYKKDNKIYKLIIENNKEYLESQDHVIGYILYPSDTILNNRIVVF